VGQKTGICCPLWLETECCRQRASRCNSHVPHTLQADRLELVSALVMAFGVMILRDGLFHSDPHPGNIFTTSSGLPHRIALLDYGQVRPAAPPHTFDVLAFCLKRMLPASLET
jgi:hypothetical protein